jgi:uncharacterized protein (TIGR02145 family)
MIRKNTLLLILIATTTSLSVFAQTQKTTKSNTSETKGSSATTTKKKAVCQSPNVFKPNYPYGKLVDQDGNSYKTVKILNQEWMAENLKVSHYRNGNAIAIVSNPKDWSALSTGATCWYNNDSAANHCVYGKLYNWFAVADERHVCPLGWHEPTDDDWTILEDNLSGSVSAGGKLKSTGLQYWKEQNISADNSSGFSAIPGGNRFSNGPYLEISQTAYWWSITPSSSNEAWFREVINKLGLVDRNAYDRKSGFSVRCVKDK